MNIVMTHEQADLDALASLLAASLLQEHAVAILPRRMNRNVRAFVNLYGTELPFVDVRDLPSDHIDTVTLVDTQSLVTLKGMTAKTKVYVVDHHQPRPDLPENWNVSLEQVGACTTMLVENLRDHNGGISLVHASLLLLGIYEDTGSLTYASTTVRDVNAVAYLLEQGASLNLANSYLNPPLSSDQRLLYDRLLSSAENIQLHGQNIIVAVTDAEGMSEEISSVAHKLRDLIDPDALFLVVKTDEGIRLIARSTSDQIDVSAIAAHFGGGGHKRAAAALIHAGDLPQQGEMPAPTQVYNELINILPNHILPAITVGQIMSRRPMLISPDTSAGQALQLMQRFGYEGYPVVQGNKVLGLLTRRAVDRALVHKLKINAASLMEAGEVFVNPQDALDLLQKIMSDTGWGQIPVVSPDNGEIIGIVTRTDLLKNLDQTGTAIPGKKNFAEKLNKSMPPSRLWLLKTVAEAAKKQRLPVYLVGGFVRDLLINQPGFDFDIVVEGDAISLGKALTNQWGGRLTSHKRFGTAKWQITDIREKLAETIYENDKPDTNDLPESLDLISARTEFYEYPTALPTVERGSIKLDLHRRDFTINTLALRLDGRHYGDLYDYWGGLNDLDKGLIRVLHSLSFVDDPTRMLRAVRFEQRFGFTIENRTLQLIEEARDLLHQVSGDRLRHEIDLILAEKNPVPALKRLEGLGLLSEIHPDLHWNAQNEEQILQIFNQPLDSRWSLPEITGHLPTSRTLVYILWMMYLKTESLLAIIKILHLPTVISNSIIKSRQIRERLSHLDFPTTADYVFLFDSIPSVGLYAYYLTEPDPAIKGIVDQYITHWRTVQPYTNGNDLKKLGIKPGPVYRDILETLRKQWLNGKISSEVEEQKFLHHLIQTNQKKWNETL